jgi:hypothetical protein
MTLPALTCKACGGDIWFEADDGTRCAVCYSPEPVPTQPLMPGTYLKVGDKGEMIDVTPAVAPALEEFEKARDLINRVDNWIDLVDIDDLRRDVILFNIKVDVESFMARVQSYEDGPQ